MNILKCRIAIEGLAPYSQSKALQSERADNESHDAHDKRCWRERIHADESGRVYVPARAFYSAVAGAAAHRGEKIKGKGGQQWGKKFLRGFRVVTPGPLTFRGKPVTVADMKGEPIFCASDAKKNSVAGKVWRIYPEIGAGWTTEFECWVVDPDITRERVEEYAEYAGLLMGVGRYRPEKGGEYGMFKVTTITWIEEDK